MKTDKVFFILGRNPELSHAEIIAYMQSRNRTFREILFEENLLVLETNEDERFDIQEFGGIMKLGKIVFEGIETELITYLQKDELIPADKFSYATFGNIESELLKEKFKSEKKKAILKHGRKRIKFQDGKKQELPNANFNIFYHQHKNKIYLGTATQTYDSNPVKERDMNKPVRREHLAISPRLSKILINLSEAKPRDLLLDPFCGVGGILQEALLKNINVYGIDKEKQAIKDAEENLKWLTEKYQLKSKYTLENLDSRKAPDLQFKAIATETPLGKILRKKPNDNEAKNIIQNFEAYIIPILTRIKKIKKPNAKIAMTLPAIRTFKVDAQKIAKKTGLKITLNPILESRPDQFISRTFVVFQ
ncbi:hypothetical protein KAI32_03965 [Candidatus Pacearchaeota archaeon]|nr:hypothetical protein [Candidatus Pacearchaeota archaeon]